MAERNLHCPRCGKLTSIAGGRCVHCGLAVQFARRAERSGAPRAASRAAAPAAARRGAAPAESSRLDVRDRLEVEFGAAAGPVHQNAGAIPDFQTGRYDLEELRRPADAARSAPSAPAGGGGDLVSMLMDPSEDPHDHAPSAGPAVDLHGGQLQLGKSAYGEPEPAARPSEEEFVVEKTPPSAGPAARRAAQAAQAAEAAAAPAEDFQDWRRHARNRYLLTRVLPQAVALAVVIVLGPRVVGAPISMSGAYDATFSDDEGRKISCDAKFIPKEKHPTEVKGEFTCELYPGLVSMTRIDEPAALKMVMGNGKFSFAGKFDASGLKLSLGGFGASEGQAVQLTGRFVSGGRRVSGAVVTLSGQKARVELVKKPGG